MAASPRIARPPSSDDTAGRLLADRLSQQLGGLVSSLDGYTNLLADTLQHAEQRELALRILEGVVQVEQLVHQLRRYSAPIHPVVRPLAVSALVDRLRHVVGEGDWTRIVVQHNTAPPATICADPVLVQQALGAVLRNALDAPLDHPVHLSLSTDAEPGHVRIDVWNATEITGAMPPDRVFEPFFSTKHGALGMGLPMARRIAEAHGGTLELIHSTDTAGTRFAMRLPAHSEGTHSPPSAVDPCTLH